MSRDLQAAREHARAAERGEEARIGIKRQHVLTVEQLILEHGERLTRLQGARLLRYDVLWDVARDEWFADEAMVLDFGLAQLSIWAFQTYLCLSWDPLDRASRIDVWHSEVFPDLTWRTDTIPELNALVGKKLELLVAVEYQDELDALGLGDGTAYCEVCNAGDELGVRAHRAKYIDSAFVLWDDRPRASPSRSLDG